ncbi:MAG TPA: hypothetical protein VF079_06105 [Sphingomicrobium sp.]
MASRAADRGSGGVAVGRVFSRAFAAMRHNWAATLVLTLLFAALPFGIAHYLLAQVPWQFMVVTIGSTALPGTFGSSVARWFAGLLFGTIAQGAMTRPVVAAAEGRRAGVGESLGAAARVLLPLTIMGVVLAVSVIIGSTLLIIPGVLVYLLWAIAPSAEADEREGVFLALSRSQELSEGARSKVFAVVLILIAITLLMTALLGLLTVIFFWRTGVTGLGAVILGLRIAFGTVLNVLWGTVLASLYVELKEWKEGGSVETLEQVFA